MSRVLRSLRGSVLGAALAVEGPARRGLAAARAILQPSRDRLTFYWHAADPQSHLVAQLLARIARPVPLDVVPVAAPSEDVDPEPALRRAHALRDARALAAFYDLSFPPDAEAPDAERARRAAARVLRAPPEERLEAALAVGGALFSGAAVDGEPTVQGPLHARYAALRAAGHYLPGTVHYIGEWYEGVGRMNALAARLRSDGGPVLVPRARPALPRAPGAPLTMWFSFRSPYSYLAIQQIARWGRPIDLRPVLPMVMRGLPVPPAKVRYILRDAKREALRLGLPFGRVVDPVGPGAERCLAVCAAVEPERAFSFAVSASKGIWAEAVDVATDEGLMAVAERAGIDGAEVRAAVSDLEAGRARAAAHREALFAEGLWGVPSFRIGDLVTWGNDRLPLVAYVDGR